MLQYIYKTLTGFRGVFSRHHTWLVFVMIILGFMASSEMLGITSFCRFWLLDSAGYHVLLHFFRSSAWDLSQLLDHWFNWVLSTNQALRVNGRLLSFGDHTYVPKEGRKIPGVVTLHQNSETQSKPSYFKGQCWGALALCIGSLNAPFALPLRFQMHLGFEHLGQSRTQSSPTLPQHMAEMALDFALKTNQGILMILDAYFSVASLFNKVNRVYHASTRKPCVEVIVKAKKNYVAYFQADPNDYVGKGRHPLYGDSLHLMEVFDHLDSFQTVSACIYGNQEDIFLGSMDLLWKPIGRLLRFVFVKTSYGCMVLMCSDLQQDPLQAVELYCLRTRIETMFEMFKQVLHGFQCHFWSKKMPRHSRKPQSNETLVSPKPEDLKIVKLCWEATERFVNLAAIALGLLQLLALQFSASIWNRFEGFLRTRSREIPSERTTKMVVAQLILTDFLNLSPSAILREIRADIICHKIDSESILSGDSALSEAA